MTWPACSSPAKTASACGCRKAGRIASRCVPSSTPWSAGKESPSAPDRTGKPARAATATSAGGAGGISAASGSMPPRILPGWCKPGLDTTSGPMPWKRPHRKGAPVNLIGPLNRIGERIPAKKITALADGRYEIDFGTNLTGWLHLKFPPLKAGQLVRLHFADRIFPDGVHASPIGNIAVSGGSCVSFARTDGGHNLYQTYKQTSEFVPAGGARRGVPAQVQLRRIPLCGRRRPGHRAALGRCHRPASRERLGGRGLVSSAPIPCSTGSTR